MFIIIRVISVQSPTRPYPHRYMRRGLNDCFCYKCAREFDITFNVIIIIIILIR